MSDYLILTGATGLVGRYLLRDLLLAGERVAVVVRRQRGQSAELRVEQIMRFWEERLGRTLPRPVCLHGDVSRPGWDLSEADYAWLAQRPLRVLHNAAVLTFHGKDRTGEPWRTNYSGTEHTLELCRELGATRFHYVSTAYVCGKRQGVILEDELDCGQQFRNDYEASKLAAEKLVRECPWLEETTIYRPAVISGDSQTGYTNTYHGLYLYLKMASVVVSNTRPGPDGRRYTPVRIDMNADQPRNVIPVDWVSRVICHLMRDKTAHGKTFHLAPEKPVTPRNVMEAAMAHYNSYGVEFVRDEAVERPAGSVEDRIQTNRGMYADYEVTDPLFSTANLKRHAGDLPCPPIDEALIKKYIVFGEEDRWGKRPAPAPEVSRWAKDVLAVIGRRFEDGGRPRTLAAIGSATAMPRAEGSEKAASTTAVELGLDITGPGGGQWTCVLGDDHALRLVRGLPADERPLLRMTCDELFRLTEGDVEVTQRRLADLIGAGKGASFAPKLFATYFSHSPKRTGEARSRTGVA